MSNKTKCYPYFLYVCSYILVTFTSFWTCSSWFEYQTNTDMLKFPDDANTPVCQGASHLPYKQIKGGGGGGPAGQTRLAESSRHQGENNGEERLDCRSGEKHVTWGTILAFVASQLNELPTPLDTDDYNGNKTHSLLIQKMNFKHVKSVWDPLQILPAAHWRLVVQICWDDCVYLSFSKKVFKKIVQTSWVIKTLWKT